MERSEVSFAIWATAITVALAAVGVLTPIAPFGEITPWVLWPTISAYVLAVFAVCYAAVLSGRGPACSFRSVFWPSLGCVFVLVLAPFRVLNQWSAWSGFAFGSAAALLPILAFLPVGTLLALGALVELWGRCRGTHSAAVQPGSGVAEPPSARLVRVRFLLAALWLMSCTYTAAAALDSAGIPRLAHISGLAWLARVLAAPSKLAAPYPYGIVLTLLSGVLLFFRALRLPVRRYAIPSGPRLRLLLLALLGLAATFACGDIGLWSCYDRHIVYGWRDAMGPGEFAVYRHVTARAKLLLAAEFRGVQALAVTVAAFVVWREARLFGRWLASR